MRLVVILMALMMWAIPLPAKTLKWVTRQIETSAYVINPAERGKCEVYSGSTALGKQVTLSTVAVDPRIFPFGTLFIIPGLSGIYHAGDTGGYIRGNRVDIAFWSCKAAWNWGRRTLYAKVAYAN